MRRGELAQLVEHVHVGGMVLDHYLPFKTVKLVSSSGRRLSLVLSMCSCIWLKLITEAISVYPDEGKDAFTRLKAAS